MAGSAATRQRSFESARALGPPALIERLRRSRSKSVCTAAVCGDHADARRRPELAAGFLLSERVLTSADDLGTIDDCRDPAMQSVENVVNVTLTGSSSRDLDRLLAERRKTSVNSSCGLCGRLTIDSLKNDVEPLRVEGSVQAAVVCLAAGYPAQRPGRL